MRTFSLIPLIALAMVSNPGCAQAQTPSVPAEPYRAIHAPGYPKVIMPGDYPDPTILRDGRDFYMTHSAFDYTPGFLIWHSTDLVNWRPVVRALKQTGSYAPDLAKVNGKFHLYYPANGNNWVLTADQITGPWTKPANVGVGWHIDPGYAVGEDGKRYLFLSDGVRAPLSDDGLSATGQATPVYSGWEYPTNWVTECKCLESPKVFRKGDYFYLVSAEGGTAGPATSHMVVVARSKSINGPWENSPYNPLVHTYSADEQWWSKGHGTMFDDVNGNWWIVYHAYGKGQYTLGRQTLLDPIDWTPDGWPILAKTAHPLPPGDGTVGGMELSDNFSGPSLGLQWMAWRDYAGIQLANGSLVLDAKGSSPKDARLFLTTATDAAYETQVEVTVPSGGSGGLVLFYNEKAFAGLTSDGKEFTLYRDAAKVTRETNSFGGHFFLKIINHQNRCAFLASADGKTWTSLLADVDVSELQHNRFKGFLALRPGLMATGSGEVKFDRFVYKKHGEPALAAGTGASTLADARAAGLEAAKLARTALGPEAPKLVVVFAARNQLTPELVGGVAEVFDRALITGCEGYAPLTAAGNFADQGHEIKSGVAVLALGGSIAVKLVADVVRPEDGQEGFAACGRRIGGQLQAAVAAASGSKLIFTFGNQHVGSNQPFVDGLFKALGTNVPTVGAAAGDGGAKEIVQGKVVTGANVAVLLSGNFKLGVGLSGGNGDLVAKADESLAQAAHAQPGKPALLLVFDCGGRRGDLFNQKKLAAEFATMRDIALDVPLFGFYGGGEIGTAALTEPAKGVGFSVASAALFAE